LRKGTTDLEKVVVRCYSSYTYAERPICFIWRGKNYGIKSIEQEWLVPGEKWFVVKTNDNKCFKLCYNEVQYEWLVSKSFKEQENAKGNT